MILSEFINDKETYLTIVKNKWISTNDIFPDFLQKISSDKQMKNEQYISSFSSCVQNQLKKYPKFPIGHKRWRRKTISLTLEFLHQEEILGIHHFMTISEINSLQEELMDFLCEVRKFAPELDFSDIGQAIRNYIVYTMFKKLHHINTEFNMAAFGYSMLYPFTDNYIDNKNHSDEMKTEYNQLIRDKLAGKKVFPKMPHQKKTCELLQLIEDEYPRDHSGNVYHLLLMMLDAQEISILQQNSASPLDPSQRLDISIYKGGLSVLMDRCWVKKDLTREDLIFYLGFGFFLQLADDLQDIREDNCFGHSNLFTLNLCNQEEERIVNRMLHFVHELITEYPAENEAFKEFLLSNCYQLIFSSILKSKEFFSLTYLERLETYFPISFHFWEKSMESRLDFMNLSEQKNYMNLLDEMIQLN